MYLTLTDIPENALRAADVCRGRNHTRDHGRDQAEHLGGVSLESLADRRQWACLPLPALPKRRMVIRRKIVKEDRIALVHRMMKAAERQVYDIRRCGWPARSRNSAITSAMRALAVLAKTMQSLAALDALHEKEAPKAKAPKP